MAIKTKKLNAGPARVRRGKAAGDYNLKEVLIWN